MSLRQTIKNLIEQHRHEIVESNDWFYALDNYEVNVHDYDEDGIFSVVVYPRSGCTTNWSKEYLVSSLNFKAE